MHCKMRMIFSMDLKRTSICVNYICAMFPFAYGNDISNGFFHNKTRRIQIVLIWTKYVCGIDDANKTHTKILSHDKSWAKLKTNSKEQKKKPTRKLKQINEIATQGLVQTFYCLIIDEL